VVFVGANIKHKKNMPTLQSKIIFINKQLIANLKNIKVGDLSDIGNTIGTIIGNSLSSEMGFDKKSFMDGLEHGFSLTDGTHPKPKDDDK